MRKRGKTLSLLLAFSLALGSFAPAPFGFASLGQVQAAEQEDPVTPLSGTCREQAGTFGWDLVEDPDNTIFPEGEPDDWKEHPIKAKTKANMRNTQIGNFLCIGQLLSKEKYIYASISSKTRPNKNNYIPAPDPFDRIVTIPSICGKA